MKTSLVSTLAILALAGATLAACDEDPAATETTGDPGAGGNGVGGATTVGGGPGSGGDGASSGPGGNAPEFTGYTQVDGSGDAEAGSADIAIAPDGTIYVSWVDVAQDVRVAQSTDGGQTFSTPVTLDDASLTPLVTKARHPWIAADLDRVAVAFNDMAGTVYLYVSDAGGALDFGTPTTVGTDVTTTFRDFTVPIFLPDGSIAVGFQGYPASGGRIFLSRESDGYASEVASSGAPGEPCDCCPLELIVDDEGDIMAAFRNNDANDREHWVSTAPAAGAFSSFVQASTTEGIINACPMEGPRLAQLSATDHAMVYSARGPSGTGSVTVSLSSDGGATWSGGTPIPGFSGDEPTVARGASGRLYVTATKSNDRSAMAYSDDGGATWSTQEELSADDGDIGTPQAGSGAGIAALAGVSGGSNVWLLRME